MAQKHLLNHREGPSLESLQGGDPGCSPSRGTMLALGPQAWPDSMASDLGYVPGADSLLNGAEKLIKAKET